MENGKDHKLGFKICSPGSTKSQSITAREVNGFKLTDLKTFFNPAGTLMTKPQQTNINHEVKNENEFDF